MEEKERIEIVGKSLLLIILTIVISIFAWFFYGVVTVNAATQYRVNNSGNWGNWTNTNIGTLYTNNNQAITSNWRSWLQIKDTTAMLEGKKYDFKMNLTITISKSARANVGTQYTLEAFNGNNLVDIRNKCTAVQTKTNYGTFIQVKVNINCTAISGQGFYPYMSFQVQSSNYETNTSTMNFKIDEYAYTLNQGSEDTDKIVANQNENTEQIIEGINDSTENIINNQNENTEKEIESQKVCEENKINLREKTITNGLIANTNGEILNNNNWKVTDYIKLEPNYEYTLKSDRQTSGAYWCIYNENKTLISCSNYNNIINVIQTSEDIRYARFSIANEVSYYYLLEYKGCKNGNQALNESIWNFSEKLMNGENWEHEDPDDTAQDELEDYESDLDDYLINDTDISELEYSIDVNTNTAIWGIFNRLVTGNQIFYTGFLTILFLGIIKLVLAR